MKAVLLLTRPGSSFHFGDYAPFGETFLDHSTPIAHSDTLFSALVNIYNQVWPEKTTRFIAHFREGRIKISSLQFCFSGKAKTIYFLPRPALMKINEDHDRKRYKGVEWISTGIWEKGMHKTDAENKIVLPGRKFACLASEWENLSEIDPDRFKAFDTTSVPKVTVHSNTREDTLYQQTNITLLGNTGIAVNYYFLVQCNDLDQIDNEEFEAVISLLPDTGLGGQRTTGCGFFKGTNWENSPLPEVRNKDYYVNLGLLLPGDKLLECLAYRVTTRGGRWSDKGRLKKIRMIREGGLLRSEIAGEIADISPGNDGSYLRLGVPVLWPIAKGLLNL